MALVPSAISSGTLTFRANILGMNFSGFIAWWWKRTSDSLKLPQFEKKLLVTLDWILDVLFSKDPVHFERNAPVSPHAAAELKKSA